MTDTLTLGLDRCAGKRIIRVFPRRTRATPTDDLAYTGPPDLFAQADRVEISVTFTWDKPLAEKLAKEWERVAPVTVGGVAYGDVGDHFIPGRYIRSGYTFTSRGCPRRCWFSVTGDTRIHTSGGWETIETVMGRLSGRQVHCVNGASLTTFEMNEPVATPDGSAQATVFMDEGIQPVYEVSCRNGLRIKGTAEHPLLCVMGEVLVWKHIGDINPGDIVVMRAPETLPTDYVQLGVPIIRAWSQDRCNKERKIPSVLDEDLAWLIGFVIGDGCLPLDGRAAIHVCVTPEVKPRLQRVVREKFAATLRISASHRSKLMEHGWINSRLVREFFTQILGINPAEKLHVPACIFRSPKSVVAAFIDGLWAADGYSPENSRVSYLSTVSRPLADEVALLILSLGDMPYIHTVHSDSYADGISYRIGRKYVDSIPSVRGVYRSAKSGKWYWRTPKGPQRRGIERRTLNESGLHHPLNIRGWFYAEVDSVIAAGDERVYDLTVPGEEAFVANGFVAHNCKVWRTHPEPILFPITDGWNILDDNLLACPRPHVEAVFAMLRRQGRRVEFTGGLEALSLQDYQVGLLADLRPRPNCFWAYDPGDEFETLESAARRLLAAGFTARSHRLRCYVLIGHPGDTFSAAEKRLREMLRIGFTPMAMLWRPDDKPAQQRHEPSPEWRQFQRRWARPAIIHARQKP